MEKFIMHSALKEAFTCPHCGVFAQQKWIENYVINDEDEREYITLSQTEYDEILRQYENKLIY